MGLPVKKFFKLRKKCPLPTIHHYVLQTFFFLVLTNGQSWDVEDIRQGSLFALSMNDTDAFRFRVKSLKQLYGSHPMHVLQLSVLSKNYPLLCLVFFLPPQKFWAIVQCQYHVWKHKTIHLCLTSNEDSWIFDDATDSFLGIASCTFFEHLIHFFV